METLTYFRILLLEPKREIRITVGLQTVKLESQRKLKIFLVAHTLFKTSYGLWREQIMLFWRKTHFNPKIIVQY